MNKRLLSITLIFCFLSTYQVAAQTINILSAQPDSISQKTCLNDTALFNLEVALSGYTIGDSITVNFDFGDGTTSSQKTPIINWFGNQRSFLWGVPHTYTSPGTYFVETIVIAPNGTRDTLLSTLPFVIDSCATLSGTVYLDYNNDCIFNPSESGLAWNYINIQDSASPPNYYSLYTDASGNYSVDVPALNQYNVQVQFSPYPSKCAPSGGYTAITPAATNLDFGLAPTIQITNVSDTLTGSCLPSAAATVTANVFLRGYTAGDTVTASIDFGDGTIVTAKSAITGTSFQSATFNVSHTYVAAGTFYVETIVVAPNGTADTLISPNPLVVNTCGDLSGIVYIDANNDCVHNPGETVLTNERVVIHDLTSSNYYYLRTDINGEYLLNLPITTTHDVYLQNSTLANRSCPTGGYSGVNPPSTNMDFGIKRVIDITYAQPDSLAANVCVNANPGNFNVSGILTGYNAGDSVTVQLNWGDGSTSTNKVLINVWSNVGYFGTAGSHTYTAPGNYFVQVIAIAPNGVASDTTVSIIPIHVDVCGNLSGNVYLDKNNDCAFNAGDQALQNRMVTITNASSSLKHFAVTDASGNYSIDLPAAASYDVDIHDPFLATNCPVGGHSGVSVPAAGINLGLQCATGFDLYGTLWGAGFRSGFARKFTARPFNWTCTPVSGTIKVVLADPRISYSFNAAFTPAPAVNGDTITWSFSNLDHSNNWSSAVIFDFDVLTSPTAMIGDSICMEVIVAPTSGDTDPSNNVKTYCFRVVNSFDPNEKTATLGAGPDNIIPPGTRLDYTVHFQNTGNDVAYNVFIMDTLDQQLDVSTLHVEGATHVMTYDIIEDHILRFNFDNINLPDSNSNEPLSHGSVSYSIDHHAGLALGSVIENTAHIYFDFNEAIVTNTTSHRIDNLTIGLEEVWDQVNLVNVYPNPARDIITVRLYEKDQAQLEIRTLMGQLMASQQLSKGVNTVRLSELPPGIYLFEVRSGNRAQLEKIIVQGR